ncbi:hypothetical protein ACIBQ5_07450 [Streptomyces massasporeus]|uniref:hypothetical protein n=1 Tax=Streptomyces massasporeus TaxID=67324 RepID=UPI00379F9C33
MAYSSEVRLRLGPVRMIQPPTSALGDTESVSQRLGQTFGKVAEIAGLFVGEQGEGVVDELVAHVELDRLRGIGDSGGRSVVMVGDQVAVLAFRPGSGEKAEFVCCHQAASSPWTQ